MSVRGAVSDKFDLRYGVPQSSCLGPLLFTVYASALFDVMEKHLPTVHCCANDSQLYISFSLKVHSGQADAVASIEHCIQDIRHVSLFLRVVIDLFIWLPLNYGMMFPFL